MRDRDPAGVPSLARRANDRGRFAAISGTIVTIASEIDNDGERRFLFG
jgi:hypothetical protein